MGPSASSSIPARASSSSGPSSSSPFSSSPELTQASCTSFTSREIFLARSWRSEYPPAPVGCAARDENVRIEESNYVSAEIYTSCPKICNRELDVHFGVHIREKRGRSASPIPPWRLGDVSPKCQAKLRNEIAKESATPHATVDVRFVIVLNTSPSGWSC